MLTKAHGGLGKVPTVAHAIDHVFLGRGTLAADECGAIGLEVDIATQVPVCAGVSYAGFVKTLKPSSNKLKLQSCKYSKGLIVEKAGARRGKQTSAWAPPLIFVAG